MGSFWMQIFTEGTLWKLLLSLLLGGLVGLEREWHGRAAGLRTHVLVCLGSTILIITARSAPMAFAHELGGGSILFDPNRIAAGIVTGIGFLGAGAILRTGDLIRGLTTAGCIWFAAALGIVIGSGLFALGIISTLLMLLVLIVFDVIEHHIPPVVYRSITVKISSEEREDLEAWCREWLSASGVRIQEVLRRIDSAEGLTEIVFRVRARGNLKTRRLIEGICERPGVRQVRWDQQ